MGGEVYTFLFTDVVGSTQLWKDQPAAMPELLQQAFDKVRTVVERHGGQVFKSLGDGSACVFRAPESCVAAAQELALSQEIALPLRLGIHMGVAEPCPGDYMGSCLNAASHLGNIGAAGQILASGEIIERLMLTHSEARLLGQLAWDTADFKGAVFQIVVEGKLQEFPQPYGLLAHPNLPPPPEFLMGRTEERAQLKSLLLRGPTRWVSLLGFGGVGKTTLATSVANDLLSPFHHRVWWVNCEEAVEVSQVIHLIRAALDLDDPLFSIENDLADRLGSGKALIVLDCFERFASQHGLIERLLAHHSELRLLVTSRIACESFRETTVRLGGLFDGSKKRPDLSSSIELFETHAQRVLPDWQASAADRAQIRQIVRSLEGIPLAIVLVASRLIQFQLAELRALLETSLLRGARSVRSQEGRHDSLFRVISASFELLDDDAQAALIQLGVFRGGFTREAAEAVVQCQDFDRALGRLIQSSLLMRLPSKGETRFKMLDSINEFLQERLDASEEGLARKRHADYFITTFERQRDLAGAENWTAISQWLRKEQGNISVLIEKIHEFSDEADIIDCNEKLLEALFESGLSFEFHALARASLEAYEKQENVSQDFERTLGMLAVQYRRETDWDAAARVHERREKLALKNGDKKKVCEVLAELINVYLEQEDKQKLSAARERLKGARGQEDEAHRLAFDALEARIQVVLAEPKSVESLRAVKESLMGANLPVRDLLFPYVMLGHGALGSGEIALAKWAFQAVLKLGISESLPYAASLAIYGLGLSTQDQEERERFAECLDEFSTKEAPRSRLFARELRKNHKRASRLQKRDGIEAAKDLMKDLAL